MVEGVSPAIWSRLRDLLLLYRYRRFSDPRNHWHGAARTRVLNWKHLGTYLSHQRHQSATTGDLQLAEDGMEMFFHRFETQAAFIGNLLIAAPIAH